MRLSLTVNEIADLARFAGLELNESKLPDADEGEELIAIEECSAEGLLDDDGTRKRYRMIAYLDEYPEEGSYGLGEAISENV